MSANWISAPWRMVITALHLSLGLALAAGLLSSTTTVHASTTCTFTTSGTTMKLNADCTTDMTIFIPNGFTLNGNKHTITAVDPPADHFRGAVVKNAGAVAKVKNLTVTTAGLADVCDAGDDRLRGILFEGASGSIENTNVRNINQGSSGCQEGNAIEVRNAPFDGTHPSTKSVTIEDNEASNYQKTGILANGDVSVKVEDNKVAGFGPVNFIAQNGIQLGFGAKGSVEENRVSGNVYTPQTSASAGVLLFDPSNGVSVKENVISANDLGIWAIGASSAVIRNNKISGSTSDGIALDDQSGAPVNGNTVDKNNLSSNGVGIGLYGAGVTGNAVANNSAKSNGTGLFVGFGATSNTLSNNKAPNNTDDGIQVDADGNTITRNTALGNGNLDIENTGANTYSKNKCNTSSGPPVDCGTPPAATGTVPEHLVGAPSPTTHIARPFSR